MCREKERDGTEPRTIRVWFMMRVRVRVIWHFVRLFIFWHFVLWHFVLWHFVLWHFVRIPLKIVINAISALTLALALTLLAASFILDQLGFFSEPVLVPILILGKSQLYLYINLYSRVE